MADLDAKIRAKLSPVYDPPWAMKQYRAALAAVLDLHKPTEGQAYVDRPCSCMPDPDDPYVVHAWPCPTVRAIAKELGIEVGDEVIMLERAGGGVIRRDGDLYLGP